MSCQLPVASCRLLSAGKCAPIHPPTTHNPQPTTSNPQRASRGFSLTEILIVIALIVLMLALALPAFNFISGSRSVEGAQNQVSAFLSQARASAVGLQEVRGVLFYYDPASDREMMAIVHQTPAKTIDPTTNPRVQYWLGLIPDTPAIGLPKGVGIQLANDPAGAAGNADRYVGFNSLPTAGATNDPLVGDVILFDPYGRLVSAYWGLRITDAAAVSGTLNATGQLFYHNEYAANPAVAESDQTLFRTAADAPRSSIAFILFDRNLAQEQLGSGFNTDPDFITDKNASTAEQNEESWLASNSTPYCIDRYNGTLLKAQ